MVRPLTIRIVVWTLVIIALVHIMGAALFWAFHGQLSQSLANLYPTLNQSQIDSDVNNLIVEGIVPHSIFASLFFFIAMKMNAGIRWTRKAASALLVLDILAAFFAIEVATLLPAEAGYIEAVVGVSVVFQFTCLGVLWIPKSSRTYFTSANPVPDSGSSSP